MLLNSTRARRRLLAGAVLCATAAAPAAAEAAPTTHVFRMDLTVSVSTEWESHSENQVCSDWRRVLHGTGAQHVTMKTRGRLVTLRGGRLAYPGLKGTTSMPWPGAGKITLAPLAGRVTRRASYELTHQGRGETCAPGWDGDKPPSTATCGTRQAKGGLYALAPAGRTLKLFAMPLMDDPYGGECPAESTGALTLPEPVEITHGKDAMKQLANRRVRKIVVQGQSDDIVTNEPWGMGEVRQGEQISDVLWYATFRRVG